MRVILTKEECHQSLSDLCDLVAERAGLKVTDETKYDPKKWRITTEVQKEYFSYFKRKYPKVTPEELGMLWASYGPKTNVEDFSPNEPYVAEVKEGFAVNP